MNASKIILSATAAIAAIGGAFALKTSKFSGSQILLDQNYDGICTTPTVGFKATSYQQSYFWSNVTLTDAVQKQCTGAYYLINP